MCSTPYSLYITPFSGLGVFLSPSTSFAKFSSGKLNTWNVPRVHLCLQFPQGLLQIIGSIMYIIASYLEYNHTTSIAHH